MSERKPLTLEELRQMDGKPVYYKTAKQWFIVELNHPEFGDCVMNTSCQYIPLEQAARRNRFYAQEPIRIDRSTWEPCAECAPNCSWCKHYQETAKSIPDICHECKHYSNYEPDYNFCCECGRPLTDAAWETLEKRLEGRK